MSVNLQNIMTSHWLQFAVLFLAVQTHFTPLLIVQLWKIDMWIDFWPVAFLSHCISCSDTTYFLGRRSLQSFITVLYHFVKAGRDASLWSVAWILWQDLVQPASASPSPQRKTFQKAIELHFSFHKTSLGWLKMLFSVELWMFSCFVVDPAIWGFSFTLDFNTKFLSPLCYSMSHLCEV